MKRPRVIVEDHPPLPPPKRPRIITQTDEELQLLPYYQQWRRELEEHFFRYTISAATHRCWIDADPRCVRSAAFHTGNTIFTCTECGRFHYCRGLSDHCPSIYNHDGAEYVCPFSGRVLTEIFNATLGTYKAEQLAVDAAYISMRETTRPFLEHASTVRREANATRDDRKRRRLHRNADEIAANNQQRYKALEELALQKAILAYANTDVAPTSTWTSSKNQEHMSRRLKKRQPPSSSAKADQPRDDNNTAGVVPSMLDDTERGEWDPLLDDDNNGQSSILHGTNTYSSASEVARDGAFYDAFFAPISEAIASDVQLLRRRSATSSSSSTVTPHHDLDTSSSEKNVVTGAAPTNNPERTRFMDQSMVRDITCLLDHIVHALRYVKGPVEEAPFPPPAPALFARWIHNLFVAYYSTTKKSEQRAQFIVMAVTCLFAEERCIGTDAVWLPHPWVLWFHREDLYEPVRDIVARHTTTTTTTTTTTKRRDILRVFSQFSLDAAMNLRKSFIQVLEQRHCGLLGELTILNMTYNT